MSPSDSAAVPFSETDTSILLAFARSGENIGVTAPHCLARGQLLGTGAGLLMIDDEAGQWVVPPNHAVWIPPCRERQVRSHGAFSGWGVYVAAGACVTLPEMPRVMRTSGLLHEAVARAASWGAGPRDSAQRRITEVIFDEIRALPQEPFGLPMPQDARLQRVARSLLADLADSRGLDAWAATASMASRTLTRRFAAETGFSLADWRQRARLMQAMAGLAAGAPVNTIALHLGYENVSAFIAMFRRAVGTTPARFFGMARPPRATG